MSRKNEKNGSDLSTVDVDKKPVRINPRLSSTGGEILSPVSRTVTVYLPTMGERIRRHLRLPQLQQDAYESEEFWDQDEHEAIFDENGLRRSFSKHEDRYQDGLKEAKRRKNERDETEKTEKIKREKEERENFRKRIKEIIAEGDTEGPTAAE